MSFSYQDLVQRAGVDPWSLRDKLAAGDPAEINQLAQAFAGASGDAAEAGELAGQASRLKAEHYTVNGAPAYDLTANVAQTRAELGNNGEKLASIAKLLGAISGDLETKTNSAHSEVTALEGEIGGIESEYRSIVRQYHQAMDPSDRQSLMDEYVAKAVARVKAHGGAVKGMVDDYEQGLAGHLKSLADMGYIPPDGAQEGPGGAALSVDQAKADAGLVNGALGRPAGKDGIEAIEQGERTVALLNARVAAGYKLTDAERAYLDAWYNEVGADNLAKLPQYVRDAAPAMADHRRGPDGLPTESNDDAAARLSRQVVSPIADGVMNLSNPDKGGHNGLGQMPKAIQDLARTPVGWRDPDTGLLWPNKDLNDFGDPRHMAVDGLGRFTGFSDLMQTSTVHGGTEFTKELGEQAIRVKQDLNAISANASDALSRGPSSQQAYDALRAQTSDAAASHLLSVVGRNDAASSQLLLDNHDRQTLLGLNWQDDHGAADVVHGGTDRDPKTGGGTIDQAKAALAVMKEVGADRDDYLHRMSQGVKDAVVDTGINWMDTFGRNVTTGTPSDAEAHMRDVFGNDSGVGIQLSPEDRARFLEFVSGTGDRDATRFHAAAIDYGKGLVVDALKHGTSVDVDSALNAAGRIDGAMTNADYQYALDQTGAKHDQAVAAAEAAKRRDWAWDLASKVVVTGAVQSVNLVSGGTLSPFTAVGSAVVNPLIDKVFTAPPPAADQTPRQREDLFNQHEIDKDARRDYFLLSAASEAGVLPANMGHGTADLFTSDPSGHQVLKSYNDITPHSDLLEAQHNLTVAGYQQWSRAHDAPVQLDAYNEARDSIANGSYYYEPVHNSPWHDDNSARTMLYGDNVPKDGKVASLFEPRVPADPGNYYLPPWQRHN